MKKIVILFLLLSLVSSQLFGHEIKELSSFMMMGEIELRTQEGFSEPVLYKTLNHEGGMKVRVLETGKRETINDKSGQWLYVLTVAPMWVDSGEWIEKYTRFWIFLEDDYEIFEYEE